MHRVLLKLPNVYILKARQEILEETWEFALGAMNLWLSLSPPRRGREGIQKLASSVSREILSLSLSLSLSPLF